MNKDKKIDKLKKNYMNIEIPSKLDYVVEDAINGNKKGNKNIKRSVISAASIALTLGVINFNPTLANALEEIPIIGEVIKIINIRNYRINENGFDISIDVPKISGLKNKDLEYQLNKEFEDEGKKLYKEYLKEMESFKKSDVEGHIGAEMWYEVKTDNENILSIIKYNSYTEASSTIERKVYNIDKKNQTALTLEGMFEGSDYIDVISDNIIMQMKERTKKDKNEMYWLDSEQDEFNFKKIDKNQDFYINENGEIVILFDEYEVAPGAMGLVEFTIPQEIIQKLQK